MKKYVALLLLLTPVVGAQEKVVLQLKWFHQFQFAGYYAAKEKGFYQDAGFDVEIKERNVNSRVIDDVLTGSADYGIGDASIVAARLKGKPLVIASTIFQSSPLVFLTLKSSGITSPYDLKGKKIMFQRGLDGAPLTALLEMFGIDEHGYQFIPHSFNDWALLDNTADVMSAYRSNQPFKYSAKGIEYNLIDPASYGIDFYGDLLFTTEEKINNDIASVQRFVEATRKGWLYALDNQKEIATLIHEKYQSDNTLENILLEAKMTASLIKPTLVPIGSVYPERFIRIAQIYKNLKMAPEDAQLDGILLTDYFAKPFQINSRLLYFVLAVAVAFLGYLFFQMRFNQRLKTIVHEQTKELEQSNHQLKENVTLLSEQKKHIDEARRIAEEANNAKSLFLANMSHEIRTPMNGVLGTLQLLKDMPLTEEAHDLLIKATYSSEMLLTIINDILDFSKIDAQKLSLESKPFNLNNLLDSLVLSLKPVTEEKGITLQIIKGTNYNHGWLGDSVRTKQILLNLSANAVKFTQKGSVTIFLDTDINGKLFMKVEDTGIGMEQEVIENLYNRFEQADNSTTRKFGGTGLGMAICKSLIDMMKGSIQVSSKLGVGTTFEVTLPLEKTEVLASAQKAVKVEVPSLAGIKILLAEDNRINQTIFTSMMKATNCEIVIANNGQEAVDLVGQHNVDLVFMDIQMPVMDGMQAGQIIRELYPNIPIVALTANVMEEDVKRYLDCGFVHHIGKPIDAQALYVCCTKFIKKEASALKH
ncbi:ABC transporter substrate-binding protein [Thalassotalea sediminis]|uniref:ABC transporter substrate-binding protein n=1 Tax=Thalassotalea sediminis TaxID=1759089 RepID=UPI0025743213|nr:ABC transporter substrate-binding protein [Thalassotalea sediminis]